MNSQINKKILSYEGKSHKYYFEFDEKNSEEFPDFILIEDMYWKLGGLAALLGLINFYFLFLRETYYSYYLFAATVFFSLLFA